jgi:hypothetical protein
MCTHLDTQSFILEITFERAKSNLSKFSVNQAKWRTILSQRRVLFDVLLN